MADGELLSVEDAKPADNGGEIARKGFNYQDEIAANFLILMLEDPKLIRVQCETHDDIVLVFSDEGLKGLTAEYVQVKGGEADKLWSIADICQRKANRENTSIFEKSILHDEHREESLFRLVTLRPVVSELKCLTYERDSDGRSSSASELQILHGELNLKFPNKQSKKQNGIDYWIKRCLWQVRHTEEAVRNDNILRLLRLGKKEIRPVLPEHADALLDGLRRMAKNAGDAERAIDKTKKVVTRGDLRTWWEQRTSDLIHGTVSAGGKLQGKMDDALIPDDVTKLAIDMRRDYAARVRTSSYMEDDWVDERKVLQGIVKSAMISLRAEYTAGNLEIDGQEFHSRCLAKLDAISASMPDGMADRLSFMKGCMYDIADRCMLKFTRQAE